MKIKKIFTLLLCGVFMIFSSAFGMLKSNVYLVNKTKIDIKYGPTTTSILQKTPLAHMLGKLKDDWIVTTQKGGIAKPGQTVFLFSLLRIQRLLISHIIKESGEKIC